MKYHSFVVCILVAAGAVVWCGCPAPSSPVSSGASLVVPSSIDFGRVNVGSFKDTSIRFTNTGVDTLSITSQSFSSNLFKLADSTQASIKIAPSGYADVSLRFSPRDTSSVTAYDTIKSNAPTGVITLHGGGIALTRIPFIAPSVNFGNARLGVCGDTMLGSPSVAIVSIINEGNDTLRIHSVTPQSPVFSVISYDSIIPPSGLSDVNSIYLRFCPAQLGNASATLIINSNATQDSSLTITLTGTGIPYTPGAGSAFNYTAIKLDTAGKTVGSRYSVTTSIVATDLSYQGKSNVSETSDTTYFEIENNGDVSVYSPGFPTYPATNLVGNGWLTLPFGTHGQNLQLISDDQSYIDSVGASITLNIRDSSSYVGTNSITIGGMQYQSSHVHLVEEALYSAAKGAIGVVYGFELYFSPDLGFLVSQIKIAREVTIVGKVPGKAKGGGEERNLTSFQAQ